MQLDLTGEDLAAVIALCIFMAEYDDNYKVVEYEAILNGLKEYYDFGDQDELPTDYYNYADQMDIGEAFDRISGFNLVQKQFVVDMLKKTMWADGVATSDEMDLFQTCLVVLDIPSASESPTINIDLNAITPTFLSYSFTRWTQTFYLCSITTHQMPRDRDFHQWLFSYCGTKTFYRWFDTPLLKLLTEKLGLKDGKKLVIIQSPQDRESTTPNKVGSALSGKPNFVGSMSLCLLAPDGKFQGFTDRSDLLWLVEAIDTLFEGRSLTDGPDAAKYPGDQKRNMDFALKRINELA